MEIIYFVVGVICGLCFKKAVELLIASADDRVIVRPKRITLFKLKRP